MTRSDIRDIRPQPSDPTSTSTVATTYTPSKPQETANSGHSATPDCRFCSVATATRFFQLTESNPDALVPDVVVERTSSDFFAGTDATLDRALEHRASG
ncbi:MAG: hypothetical protein GY926_12765 [bacterium]|nr:hypothetical protein [bacterium]